MAEYYGQYTHNTEILSNGYKVTRNLDSELIECQVWKPVEVGDLLYGGEIATEENGINRIGFNCRYIGEEVPTISYLTEEFKEFHIDYMYWINSKVVDYSTDSPISIVSEDGLLVDPGDNPDPDNCAPGCFTNGDAACWECVKPVGSDDSDEPNISYQCCDSTDMLPSDPAIMNSFSDACNLFPCATNSTTLISYYHTDAACVVPYGSTYNLVEEYYENVTTLYNSYQFYPFYDLNTNTAIPYDSFDNGAHPHLISNNQFDNLDPFRGCSCPDPYDINDFHGYFMPSEPTNNNNPPYGHCFFGTNEGNVLDNLINGNNEQLSISYYISRYVSVQTDETLEGFGLGWIPTQTINSVRNGSNLFAQFGYTAEGRRKALDVVFRLGAPMGPVLCQSFPPQDNIEACGYHEDRYRELFYQWMNDVIYPESWNDFGIAGVNIEQTMTKTNGEDYDAYSGIDLRPEVVETCSHLEIMRCYETDEDDSYFGRFYPLPTTTEEGGTLAFNSYNCDSEIEIDLQLNELVAVCNNGDRVRLAYKSCEEGNTLHYPEDWKLYGRYKSGRDACNFVTQYNSNDYYLSDNDKRPALGIFQTEDDNELTDNFLENLSNEKFSQYPKGNLLSNGNGKFIHPFVGDIDDDGDGQNNFNYSTLGSTTGGTDYYSRNDGEPYKPEGWEIYKQNKWPALIDIDADVSQYSEAGEGGIPADEPRNSFWSKNNDECLTANKCLIMDTLNLGPSNYGMGSYFAQRAIISNEQNLSDTNLNLQPYQTFRISFYMKTTVIDDSVNIEDVGVGTMLTFGGTNTQTYTPDADEDGLGEGYAYRTSEQNAYYNSLVGNVPIDPNNTGITNYDVNTTENEKGWQSGIGRFNNTKLNLWEKFEYIVAPSYDRISSNLKSLKGPMEFYVFPKLILPDVDLTNTYSSGPLLQYYQGNNSNFPNIDKKAVIYLDNFEVKESYDFNMDVDVRKKISTANFGKASLTKYYDPTIEEQVEAYNDTTAPLEAQFYFYPRFPNNDIFSNSDIMFDDFSYGYFYIYDVDWGDNSPIDFKEPEQLNNSKMIYHYFKESGIYEITGTILRMKPESVQGNYIGDLREYSTNTLGVVSNKRFTLRININEGADEDFTYFGSDGFSFIPYKNTTPIIGGYSKESIYYKSIKRNNGLISDDIKVDVNFDKISDKLKTEIALNKLNTSFDDNLNILNEFKKERFSLPDELGDKINNGLKINTEEIGKSVGDSDITNVRYFNEPKQIWELLGDEDWYERDNSDCEDFYTPSNAIDPATGGIYGEYDGQIVVDENGNVWVWDEETQAWNLDEEAGTVTDDNYLGIYGCMDSSACNYNSQATINNFTCTFPTDIVNQDGIHEYTGNQLTELAENLFKSEIFDCAGECLNDQNNNGICDENDMDGCSDSEACNYNQYATNNDGSCVYPVNQTITFSTLPPTKISPEYPSIGKPETLQCFRTPAGEECTAVWTADTTFNILDTIEELTGSETVWIQLLNPDGEYPYPDSSYFDSHGGVVMSDFVLLTSDAINYILPQGNPSFPNGYIPFGGLKEFVKGYTYLIVVEGETPYWESPYLGSNWDGMIPYGGVQTTLNFNIDVCPSNSGGIDMTTYPFYESQIGEHCWMSFDCEDPPNELVSAPDGEPGEYQDVNFYSYCGTNYWAPQENTNVCTVPCQSKVFPVPCISHGMCSQYNDATHNYYCMLPHYGSVIDETYEDTLGNCTSCYATGDDAEEYKDYCGTGYTSPELCMELNQVLADNPEVNANCKYVSSIQLTVQDGICPTGYICDMEAGVCLGSSDGRRNQSTRGLEHVGNPSHLRYWKNIIPENYSIYNRKGLDNQISVTMTGMADVDLESGTLGVAPHYNYIVNGNIIDSGFIVNTGYNRSTGPEVDYRFDMPIDKSLDIQEIRINYDNNGTPPLLGPPGEQDRNLYVSSIKINGETFDGNPNTHDINVYYDAPQVYDFMEANENQTTYNENGVSIGGAMAWDGNMVFEIPTSYFSKGLNKSIDIYSQQEWIDNYYYPVLPRYEADGLFQSDSLPCNRIPFPLNAPITNDNLDDKSLKININTNQIDINVLDDESGNNNKGFVFSDFKPKFDIETLTPKKTKNTNRIKSKKTKGPF